MSLESPRPLVEGRMKKILLRAGGGSNYGLADFNMPIGFIPDYIADPEEPKSRRRKGVISLSEVPRYFLRISQLEGNFTAIMYRNFVTPATVNEWLIHAAYLLEVGRPMRFFYPPELTDFGVDGSEFIETDIITLARRADQPGDYQRLNRWLNNLSGPR